MILFFIGKNLHEMLYKCFYLLMMHALVTYIYLKKTITSFRLIINCRKMVGIDAKNKDVVDPMFICPKCSLIIRDPIQLK